MLVRASIIYPYLSAMGITQLYNREFDVQFLDCPTMELNWASPELDALDEAELILMEARTPIINYIYRVSDELRASVDAKVALFGDHVTWDADTALMHADYIILGGDYDYGALQLADALKYRRHISPKFNAGLVDHLDSLPFVNREIVPYDLYYESWRNRKTFVWTMSGRGCLYNCTFCAWIRTLWNNKFRLRTPENVAMEFDMIHDELGDCEILDDNDLFDTTWGAKFAQKLIDMGYKHKEILWACQTHPNMINNLENLKLMRRSGLRTVKLGVESGNQETLDRMCKKTTVRQIETAVHLLQEANIAVHANLMVGWPWETKQQAYHTIEWIKKLQPNQAQFSLIIPYPNTALYDEARANGWLRVGDTDWDDYTAAKPMMTMKDMMPEEVVKLYKDCWKQFYLDPQYIIKHIFAVRHWTGVKQLWNGFRSVYFGHMRAIDDE